GGAQRRGGTGGTASCRHARRRRRRTGGSRQSRHREREAAGSGGRQYDTSKLWEVYEPEMLCAEQLYVGVHPEGGDSQKALEAMSRVGKVVAWHRHHKPAEMFAWWRATEGISLMWVEEPHQDLVSPTGTI